MTTPLDKAEQWVSQLRDLKVRATTSPNKLTPPCVLIAPPVVEVDSMCGGQGQWTAYVLASGGVGNDDAWRQLDDLTLKAFDVLPVERITPAEYRPDETNGYPAFELTWTETTEWRI